jgi:hypothetical protein
MPLLFRKAFGPAIRRPGGAGAADEGRPDRPRRFVYHGGVATIATSGRGADEVTDTRLLIRELFAAPPAEVRRLHADHINPVFVDALGLLGYGRHFVGGEGASLRDAEGREYLGGLPRPARAALRRAPSLPRGARRLP